jgi:hypothetical protein
VNLPFTLEFFDKAQASIFGNVTNIIKDINIAKAPPVFEGIALNIA